MIGFFDRLGNGWHIAQQSWSVLRENKQLLLFPVFSGIAALAVLATFAAPILLIPNLRAMLLGAIDQGPNPNQFAQFLSFALLFAFYVANYFVIVYFNTALAACAIYHFQGGEPTVGMGLQMANRRLPQIFAWSILAATVGVILHAIEERAEWLGRIISGILGGLWTIATYLVVPTLAVEGLGPVDALKRSVTLIRQVWGEGMGGNANISLIGFLLFLPALALMIALVFLQVPTPVLVVAIVAMIVYALAISVVTAAVKQVFIAGLYVYATEKRVPAGFDHDAMSHAFAPKK